MVQTGKIHSKNNHKSDELNQQETAKFEVVLSASSTKVFHQEIMQTVHNTCKEKHGQMNSCIEQSPQAAIDKSDMPYHLRLKQSNDGTPKN